MSTPLQASPIPIESIPDGSTYRLGLVVAEWNQEITAVLEYGALEILLKSGVKKENLFHLQVPGSYELVSGAQLILENRPVDAVICLGCVIQGETPHFDFICQAVSNGLISLTLKYNKPVIFGVLTTLNLDQAKERSGGKYGNKGEEGALTALKMIKAGHTLLKNKNTPVGYL